MVWDRSPGRGPGAPARGPPVGFRGPQASVSEEAANPGGPSPVPGIWGRFLASPCPLPGFFAVSLGVVFSSGLAPAAPYLCQDQVPASEKPSPITPSKGNEGGRGFREKGVPSWKEAPPAHVKSGEVPAPRGVCAQPADAEGGQCPSPLAAPGKASFPLRVCWWFLTPS